MKRISTWTSIVMAGVVWSAGAWAAPYDGPTPAVASPQGFVRTQVPLGGARPGGSCCSDLVPLCYTHPFNPAISRTVYLPSRLARIYVIQYRNIFTAGACAGGPPSP